MKLRCFKLNICVLLWQHCWYLITSTVCWLIGALQSSWVGVVAGKFFMVEELKRAHSAPGCIE